ncbi:hypothetical protein GVN24_04080 [Rhizobium sp. CRIBSB]|nr:hypothetical protein [Rhizobium sp. CRIBSB]
MVGQRDFHEKIQQHRFFEQLTIDEKANSIAIARKHEQLGKKLDSLQSIAYYTTVTRNSELESAIQRFLSVESLDLGDAQNVANFKNKIEKIDNNLNESRIDSIFPLELLIEPESVTSLDDFNNRLSIQLTKYAAETSQIALGIIDDMRSKQGDFDRIISSARQRLGTLESDTQASNFLMQSREFASQAKHWLTGTFICVLCTIGFAFYTIHQNINFDDSIINALHLLPHLLIASVLIFAIRACARNYQELMERSHEDKLKANAFQSMTSYIDTVEDPKLRNEARIDVVSKLLLRGYTHTYNDTPPQSLLNVNMLKENK